MKSIDERVEEFLKDFDFCKAEWDGAEKDCSELTCFTETGEPFGASEFILGTHTRKMWLDLEELLQACERPHQTWERK